MQGNSKRTADAIFARGIVEHVWCKISSFAVKRKLFELPILAVKGGVNPLQLWYMSPALEPGDTASENNPDNRTSGRIKTLMGPLEPRLC